MNTNSKELEPIMPPTERKNFTTTYTNPFILFLVTFQQKSYNEKKIMIAWNFAEVVYYD